MPTKVVCEVTVPSIEICWCQKLEIDQFTGALYALSNDVALIYEIIGLNACYVPYH